MYVINLFVSLIFTPRSNIIKNLLFLTYIISPAQYHNHFWKEIKTMPYEMYYKYHKLECANAKLIINMET
jgi:hypothetical protein